MKTFKAIFTKEKLPDEEAMNMKEYTFNSKDNVAVGDFFFAKEYGKHLQVIFVFSETYEYVNVKTGELNKTERPFPFVKIKEVSIHESKADGATGTTD